MVDKSGLGVVAGQFVEQDDVHCEGLAQRGGGAFPLLAPAGKQVVRLHEVGDLLKQVAPSVAVLLLQASYLARKVGAAGP